MISDGPETVMRADDLTRKIGDLANHLRENRVTTPPTLVEVASVTEILIGTMQAYFRSIDTSIYREFRSLADYISKARGEIAALRPNEMQAERLPRAGKELEAIVRSTEVATHKIMTAAEAIMGADSSDPDVYANTVNDACMEIFEACSFQDITGQRITKVIETLTYIEDRVGRLKDALGAGLADTGESSFRKEGDAALVNGPALDGEGVSQDEVDNLMGDEAATPGDNESQSQSDIDALFR